MACDTLLALADEYRWLAAVLAAQDERTRMAKESPEEFTRELGELEALKRKLAEKHNSLLQHQREHLCGSSPA